MSDNASDYPAQIDPEPVVLEDDADHVPLDALIFALAMAKAIQGEIGNDAVRFTGIGGIDFGTIQSFIFALCRVEVGTFTVADVKGGFRVNFTTGRFTAKPFVRLQLVAGSEPNARDHYFPKRVSIEGFTVGTGHLTRANAAGNTVNWIAIQPLFGVEQSPEDVDD